MWILSLLACNCKTATPRPEVPDIERTTVHAAACYGEADGIRVALDLSASNEVPGSVITPDSKGKWVGRRKGRRIQLGPHEVELRGQTLIYDPEGEALTLKRIGCPER